MTQAPPSITTPTGLVGRLDLAATSGRWQYGLYHGYPIAATIFASSPNIERAGLYLDDLGEALATTPVMLSVQIRHPLTAAELPQGSVYQIDGRLEQLLNARDATFRVEDRIAWLDFDLRRCETAEAAAQLVADALGVLSRTGVGHGDGLCHYCRTNPAPDISFANDRVTAICQQCLASRMESAKQAHAAKPIAPSRVMLGAACGSVIGAIAWAACWFITYLIVTALAGPTGVSSFPFLLLIGTCFGSALAITWPIAWLIGRAKSRSSAFAIVVALAASGGALLGGELIYGTLVYMRETGKVSLLYGALTAALLWTGWSAIYVLCRVLTILWALAGTPYIVSKNTRQQNAMKPL